VVSDLPDLIAPKNHARLARIVYFMALIKFAKLLIKYFSITVVRCYQVVISPLFMPCCRYAPTCSEYAIEAIQKHGVKGVVLAIRRIMRCQPWNKKSGYDPVPSIAFKSKS
jgi:uncharacterized protein